MKIAKKILCLMLAVLTVCSLCACGGGGSTSSANEETPEEQVRSAVETRGYIAYFGVTIGGNEIKRSQARITNVEQISETEYRVSGKMVMTDIYATNWSNNFDCKVTQKSDGSWSAGSFNYTSKNWTKG